MLPVRLSTVILVASVGGSLFSVAPSSAASVRCDHKDIDGRVAQPFVIRTNDTVIRYCTFHDFRKRPVVIDGASNVVIEDNTFRNIGVGKLGQKGVDVHAIDVPSAGEKSSSAPTPSTTSARTAYSSGIPED